MLDEQIGGNRGAERRSSQLSEALRKNGRSGSVHLVNLETFACMAELGGLTPAARFLGIPKSTVARRVERLEAELGIALVQRTGRGMTLTDDGRALLEGCTASLRDIHAVKDTLTDSSARPTGKLHISLPADGSGSVDLINVVTTFGASFPNVHVHLGTIGVTQTSLDRLEHGSDVVLQFSISGGADPLPPGTDHVISRRLGTVPMAVVASVEYIEAHGAPRDLGDLSRHRCLVIGAGTWNRHWKLWDSSGHLVEVPIKPAFVTDSAPTLLALVLAGAGVALMPHHVSQGYIEQGLIRRILPQWSPPPLILHLQWLRSRHLAPRVRSFVDHAQSRLPDLRWLITSRE